MREGCLHKSHQLTYLYHRYIGEALSGHSLVKTPHLNAEQMVIQTIKEIRWFLDQKNIEIVNCDNFLSEENFVGFFTEDRVYVAKYKDVNPHEGEVNVPGELITVKEVVEVYSKHIADKYAQHTI